MVVSFLESSETVEQFFRSEVDRKKNPQKSQTDMGLAWGSSSTLKSSYKRGNENKAFGAQNKNNRDIEKDKTGNCRY